MADLPNGAIATRFDSIDRIDEISKRPWARGPWDHEPDRVEWRAHGFPCLIVRQRRSGHLCGYVGVEPGHPWHGVDLTGGEPLPSGLEYPDVHGGITYGAECHGNICHVARPGEPEHVFWQGFDAMHAWDVAPYCSDRALHDSSYKTIGFMVRECDRLAEQAAALRKAT